MAGGGELEGGRPVGRGVDLVLAGLQVDHEGADDLRLVVDHKHPGHRGPAFLLFGLYGLHWLPGLYGEELGNTSGRAECARGWVTR
ncbi:hypothetical protein GCM10010284_18600 [Streptomyces rubiginosohelvolus]|uniref:Uncharacterized protein n=1 Tax=Streptomyces rubiginosohelvolus TaxID=67362 RepID=A0ABQ3BIN8_9ACTN|nr:hypothetical protein GCM10010284_18600 [Streptomyces rubiginosohelvolus]GGZ47037.1 hypothetical protein GCM10010328_21770 [Streptomyces pluricolorescens]